MNMLKKNDQSALIVRQYSFNLPHSVVLTEVITVPVVLGSTFACCGGVGGGDGDGSGSNKDNDWVVMFVR